jgi:hypothetical protein
MRVLALCFLTACIGSSDADKPDADTDTDTDTDVPVDADADGYDDDVDCDDGDADIHPGATEVCDIADVDEDCDGDADNADDSTANFITLYRDADADGYGDADQPAGACEVVAGYTTDAADCDDAKATINPLGVEICDDVGADEDCDGLVDDADDSVGPGGRVSSWADADGDGWGDAAAETVTCDIGAGRVTTPGDCDDAAAAVAPDAVETCNAVDDDCDGTVDGPDAVDATTWHADADGDGYGSPDAVAVTCEAPSAYVVDATDCDDTDAAISPASVEVCNDTDDDCDGAVDPDTAAGAPTWYADVDGDTYGDASAPRVSCDAPGAHVADATDCDDTAIATNPAATEVCDAGDTDEDCDGNADDADPSADAASMNSWYADSDGDGYGDPDTALSLCNAVPGWIATAGDCDDAAATVHPGGAEVCDAADADEDCDGLADDDDTSVDTATRSTWYRDLDADGYAGTAITTSACDEPTGYEATATDCDDARATAHPGATERCDSADIDEDCDGLADDADDAAAGGTWHTDADGDGFGDEGAASCEPASGLVADSQDCDDTDDTVNPDADDTCGDGRDADCNGVDLCEYGRDDASFVATGGVTGDSFGYTVATGDVDGDGYDDVLGGAPDAAGGAAYLFSGNQAGALSASRGEEDARFTGDAVGDYFGSAVAIVDLDGDGYAEVAVGAKNADAYAGTISLFRGPASGAHPASAADVTWTAAVGGIGTDMASGDLTGDGVVELIVGGGNISTSAGVFILQATEAGTYGVVADAEARLAPGSYWGTGRTFDVADLDGDGVDDLVFGAPYSASYYGTVGVVYGPIVGVVEADAADVFITGDRGGRSFGGAQLGDRLAAGGDADGDGYGDILASAWIAANDGYAYWWGAAPGADTVASMADATFDGNDRASSYRTLGFTLETGGDLNDDGTDDFAIADGDSGEVFIWLGSPGLGGAYGRDDADLTFEGYMNWSTVFTPSFDGDDRTDLVLGGTFGVHVFPGSSL